MEKKHEGQACGIVLWKAVLEIQSSLETKQSIHVLDHGEELFIGFIALSSFYFPPAGAVFNTELHVCIQRITSVLFYEIHSAGLVFYPSRVQILLSCVMLAAEGSQALELCNIFSLCRSRKLFMGWYSILLLDFLTKLALTVFWRMICICFSGGVLVVVLSMCQIFFSLDVFR